MPKVNSNQEETMRESFKEFEEQKVEKNEEEAEEERLSTSLEIERKQRVHSNGC